MKLLITLSLAFIAALILFPNQALAGGLRPPSSLRLDRVECGTPPKAHAYFSWDPFEFATSYKFYSKIADGLDTYRTYDEVITSPSHTFAFNPKFDFYVGVSSVNTFNGEPPSVTESEKTEYFLSAKRVASLCETEEENSEEASITPLTTPQLSSQDKEDLRKSQSKVQELEEKINKLEGKVAETKRKQNFLEQLINRILSIFGQR